ncbi:MAG: outer membrane protein assembly factor BamD [Gammaproteobacteria bacterium]|nr:outer membrane protein assembly factor BamD [Gammaproteobacteria bacterium]MBU1414147.1 outer membrane protein assembly factor BamD [Gammaproteobacteria bacterium]
MRSVAALLVSLFLFGVAGCSSTPEADETLSWSASKLYSEAKDAMSSGAYDRAIKYYEKLEARYPYGRYAQQAQLEAAYAYYKQYEPASALSACDRFIRLHPNHPNVDYAYYLKGLVNFNEDLGMLGGLGSDDMSDRDPKAARDAFLAFRELVTRFPDSRYAKDARLRMSYLVNAMASHEVHVARYYLRRGAYVAAIGRAQAAITTYPEAPALEEALGVLINGYNALGIEDLRADAERVLKKNFPNSPYLAKGYDPDRKPWWLPW